ncbi:MAG: glycosyltransferase [Vicinamibacterales bacterium]
MARILFVQPSFQPPGGGNGVAAWMLQAVAGEHDVTVLTWRAIDFDAVNRFYGTSLRPSDVALRQVGGVSRAIVERIPTSMALMRSALLGEAAYRIASGFDLTMTANNEAEFGRPNIQYVHYPAYLRPRPRVDIRWFHHPELMLDAYYWLADRLHPMTRERLVRSRTLVNSDWTGRHFTALHGGRTETLYPPIAANFTDVPWASRANGFVCIGRIAPEKRVERIVDIVAGVRRVHPDAHLHIVGSPGERRYYRGVMALVRGLPWVAVHEDVSRDEVRQIIETHRYGLHAMVDEHFGMAPAEMVCGGCLVWVADSGGQVEIVEGDPRFVYQSVDDAVGKILAMMGDPAAERQALARFAGRRHEWSAGRFQERVRAIVGEMLDGASSPSAALAASARKTSEPASNSS